MTVFSALLLREDRQVVSLSHHNTVFIWLDSHFSPSSFVRDALGLVDGSSLVPNLDKFECEGIMTSAVFVIEEKGS